MNTSLFIWIISLCTCNMFLLNIRLHGHSFKFGWTLSFLKIYDNLCELVKISSISAKVLIKSYRNENNSTILSMQTIINHFLLMTYNWPLDLIADGIISIMNLNKLFGLCLSGPTTQTINLSVHLLLAQNEEEMMQLYVLFSYSWSGLNITIS